MKARRHRNPTSKDRKRVVPNEQHNEVDAQFDATLRRFVKRNAVNTAQCAGFDADTAAAYLERSLTPSARVQYDEHLASCVSCRRHLLELARLMPPQNQPVAEPASTVGSGFAFLSRWFNFSGRMWGGIAAVGVAAVLLVIGITPLIVSRRPTAVATSRATARESEAVPSAGSAQIGQAPAPTAMQAPAAPASKEAFNPKLKSSPQAADLSASRSRAEVVVNSVPLSAPPEEVAKAGSVSGTVSDTQGAAIANAQVKLIDPATQQARATTTNAAGEFNFVNVTPGKYLVEAQAPGFVTQSNATRTQESGEALALRLRPGSASETVEIAGNLKSQPPAEGKAEVTTLSEPDTNGRRQDKEAQSSVPGGAAYQKRAEVRREEREKGKLRAEQADAAPPAKTADEASLSWSEQGRAATARKRSDVAAAAPSAAPSHRQAKPRAMATPPPTRRIGDKTFRRENGQWVDTQYRPADNLSVTRLAADSDEFRRATDAQPGLKAFVELKPVIVVWQGRVYQIN